jgi:hypothetical protein
MIIKGSSRAGPSQLARHLQRTDTNGRVEIIQLDSPMGSLAEALRDWQFLSTGTRGEKGLYHANIDPDARYKMTPEQWQRAVEVLEKELGLEGQPRAVVMHEKHGRAHIHVVWQRTDIDTMTLIADSFNYKAHERASLALEKEFGHEIVPGKHAKRDREKQPEHPKEEINHAEWQQGERAGIDPRAFKDAITALYRRSDNGAALQAALEDHGLILAKGDRRDYVIVDEGGQVYSLARQIKGVTAKDLRAFMADIDRETVPSVDEAKARQAARDRIIENTPTPDVPADANEERARIEAAVKARHEEEARRLQERHTAEHQQTARILDEEIAAKLKDYDAVQQAARNRYDWEHAPKLDALSRFLAALQARFNPRQTAEDEQLRDAARAAFVQEQNTQRLAYVATLNGAKDNDLANLGERHAQQQREHAARLDDERARYVREYEAAERLRAEIEERRRQREELQAEQQRSRDGPPLGRAR